MTILDAVLDVLNDGKPRTGIDLAKEVVEKIGCSHSSVLSTLSVRVAHDRRVRRTPKTENGFRHYIYQRVWSANV